MVALFESPNTAQAGRCSMHFMPLKEGKPSLRLTSVRRSPFHTFCRYDAIFKLKIIEAKVAAQIVCLLARSVGTWHCIASV